MLFLGYLSILRSRIKYLVKLLSRLKIISYYVLTKNKLFIGNFGYTIAQGFRPLLIPPIF